jgi:hypothetical protein
LLSGALLRQVLPQRLGWLAAPVPALAAAQLREERRRFVISVSI